MNRFIRLGTLSFVFCMVLGNFIFAMAPSSIDHSTSTELVTAHKPNHHKVIILLHDIPCKDKPDAIDATFCCALVQHTAPIIVTWQALKKILRNREAGIGLGSSSKHDESDDDDSEEDLDKIMAKDVSKIMASIPFDTAWSCFKTSAGSYVLLVPGNNVRPDEYGFNANLQPLDLKETAEHSQSEHKIDELKEIFNEQAPGTWNIFMVGHGMTNLSIAGLPKTTFKDFINFLTKKLHVFSFYYATCYGGGTNLLEAYKDIYGNQSTYPFTIISHATTESVSTAMKPSLYALEHLPFDFDLPIDESGHTVKIYCDTDFESFFSAIDVIAKREHRELLAQVSAFREKHNIQHNLTNKWSWPLFFINTLNATRAHLFAQNTPLVRYPNTTFFQPVIVPVPNQALATKHVDVMTEVDARHLEEKTFTLANIGTLLWYPSTYWGRLKIATNASVQIVSMNPDHSIHIISKVEAPEIRLHNLIEQGFLHRGMPDNEESRSEKIFFIEELKTQDYRAKNVFIAIRHPEEIVEAEKIIKGRPCATIKVSPVTRSTVFALLEGTSGEREADPMWQWKKLRSDRYDPEAQEAQVVIDEVGRICAAWADEDGKQFTKGDSPWHRQLKALIAYIDYCFLPDNLRNTVKQELLNPGNEIIITGNGFTPEQRDRFKVLLGLDSHEKEQLKAFIEQRQFVGPKLKQVVMRKQKDLFFAKKLDELDIILNGNASNYTESLSVFFMKDMDMEVKQKLFAETIKKVDLLRRASEPKAYDLVLALVQLGQQVDVMHNMASDGMQSAVLQPSALKLWKIFTERNQFIDEASAGVIQVMDSSSDRVLHASLELLTVLLEKMKAFIERGELPEKIFDLIVLGITKGTQDIKQSALVLFEAVLDKMTLLHHTQKSLALGNKLVLFAANPDAFFPRHSQEANNFRRKAIKLARVLLNQGTEINVCLEVLKKTETFETDEHTDLLTDVLVKIKTLLLPDGELETRRTIANQALEVMQIETQKWLPDKNARLIEDVWNIFFTLGIGFDEATKLVSASTEKDSLNHISSGFLVLNFWKQLFSFGHGFEQAKELAKKLIREPIDPFTASYSAYHQLVDHLRDSWNSKFTLSLALWRNLFAYEKGLTEAEEMVNTLLEKNEQVKAQLLLMHLLEGFIGLVNKGKRYTDAKGIVDRWITHDIFFHYYPPYINFIFSTTKDLCLALVKKETGYDTAERVVRKALDTNKVDDVIELCLELVEKNHGLEVASIAAERQFNSPEEYKKQTAFTLWRALAKKSYDLDKVKAKAKQLMSTEKGNSLGFAGLSISEVLINHSEDFSTELDFLEDLDGRINAPTMDYSRNVRLASFYINPEDYRIKQDFMKSLLNRLALLVKEGKVLDQAKRAAHLAKKETSILAMQERPIDDILPYFHLCRSLVEKNHFLDESSSLLRLSCDFLDQRNWNDSDRSNSIIEASTTLCAALVSKERCYYEASALVDKGGQRWGDTLRLATLELLTSLVKKERNYESARRQLAYERSLLIPSVVPAIQKLVEALREQGELDT